MNAKIRALVRPLYQFLVRSNPVMQAIVRREASSAMRHRIISEFIEHDWGVDYGITSADRKELVNRIVKNTSHIQAATNEIQHIIMAQEILSIPRKRPGDVVECGAFKGASSASLSLICKLTGRKLLVCDSFAGLPDDGMKLHVASHMQIYGFYREGMFCGTLDEVKANIKAFGAPEVCEYVVGFFSESLKSLRNPIAFAFLDVDLVSSTRDCLKYIWPLLIEDGAVYTDDAGDLECVKVFFDDAWWQENLGCPAPGFVGSGCGLPVAPACAAMGYIRKVSKPEMQFKRASHLYYPDESKAVSN